MFMSLACNQEGSLPAGPENPLVGVWKIVHDEEVDASGQSTDENIQSSLVIITPGYYSMVYTFGTEPRPTAAEHFNPTDEEKITAYNSIIVNTGTYELSGSKITFKPMVAKSQAYTGGGYSESEYRMGGDTLFLTSSGPVSLSGKSPAFFAEGGKGSSTLIRIE